MSQLFCEYDRGNPKTEIASRKCDFCGKLLCKICGYKNAQYDFCNECWAEIEEDEKFDYHPRPEEENLKVEVNNKVIIKRI